MKSSRTGVAALAMVLVTVVWFQLVWRGHGEQSADAATPAADAAVIVEVPTDPGAAAVDPALADPVPTDPAAADPATPSTGSTTQDSTSAGDAVARLRLVQQAVTAGGATLTSYTPSASGDAEVHLTADYAGLVEFLRQIRALDPTTSVATLGVEPGEGTLAVAVTIHWRSS